MLRSAFPAVAVIWYAVPSSSVNNVWSRDVVPLGGRKLPCHV